MSAEEGHGSVACLEVDPGPSLEVNPGHGLEVDLGPVLEVGPEFGRELKVKVVTALTPRMSILAP